MVSEALPGMTGGPSHADLTPPMPAQAGIHRPDAPQKTRLGCIGSFQAQTPLTAFWVSFW